MRLAAFILLFTPLLAEAPLVVRNVRFDVKKMVVDFDLSNASAKPVHAWLIDVAAGDLTSRMTPQNCRVLAEQSWHCTASVDSARGTPAVRMNAVLFTDGTATGNLKMLQAEIDDASLRLRAIESWQKDFHETPPDIAYTSAVMTEREIVELFAAKETPAQVAAMLQQRANLARDRVRLFPAHDPPYAPPEAVRSTRTIANRASRFPIVLQEERTGRVRLVLRNDYDKEIVAFAFIERQPDGRLMRSSSGHTVAPGGLREFDYGPMDNPVELACVVFRDGTADGDPAVVQKVRDGEAGRKAEKARILPLVHAVANLPASARAAAVDKLIADISAHPQEQPDADHSIDFVLGEQAERKTVLRELRDSSIDEVLKDLQERP